MSFAFSKEAFSGSRSVFGGVYIYMYIYIIYIYIQYILYLGPCLNTATMDSEG